MFRGRTEQKVEEKFSPEREDIVKESYCGVSQIVIEKEKKKEIENGKKEER